MPLFPNKSSFLVSIRAVFMAVFICTVIPSNAREVRLRFESLTVQDGLSQSSVHCILRDHQGFMWFGTEDGLNRYDGYDFLVFQHSPQDSKTIAGSYVSTLYQDSANRLWVGTFTGLSLWVEDEMKFETFTHDPDNPKSLSADRLSVIYEDGKGILWVGTYAGLNAMDPEQMGVFRQYAIENGVISGQSPDKITAICEDSEGVLWVGSTKGLFRFDRETGSFQGYHHDPENTNSLSADQVTSLAPDEKGNIWVGTVFAGLNKFTPATNEWVRYIQDPDIQNSLVSNSINHLLRDGKGNIWVATLDNGLGKWDENKGEFTSYPLTNYSSRDAATNMVNTLYEDPDGILWVGVSGGGIKKVNPSGSRFEYHGVTPDNKIDIKGVNAIFGDRDGYFWIATDHGGVTRVRFDESQEVQPFVNNPKDPSSIGSEVVSAIHQAEDGVIWFATFGGGLAKWTAGQKGFIHLGKDGENSPGLSSNWFSSILQTQDGALWFGSLDKGIFLLQPGAESFANFSSDPAENTSISGNQVSAIREDHSGRLWIGTMGSGLNRMDRKTGRFFHYLHDPDNPNGLSSNDVISLHVDYRGQLWLGTLAGLNMLKEDQSFIQYSKEDGLPNDVIYAILEDGDHNLWVSTNQGISRFQPVTSTFENFDITDGLEGNEFNQGACFQTDDGKLFFGGLHGLNSFYAEKIQPNMNEPSMVIIDLLLNNKPVPLTQLKTRMSADGQEERYLDLDSKHDTVAFKFAALHYDRPEKNRYAYRLQGFNRDWIEKDASDRIATYTNLDPKSYLFQVKGSNSDRIWNEKGLSLVINVAPPAYKTWWAYTLYGLTLTLILILFLGAQKRQLEKEREMTIRNQRIAERERLTASRLRQLDKLKDNFLANTSHELRTPLNGIIGLTESLIDGAAGRLTPQQTANLAMIVSCSRRLHNLVNDILDFSKLKDQELEMRMGPVDLKALTYAVLTLSRPLADKKFIKLIDRIPDNIPTVEADPDRLQQIMYNLVGNGIKFTEKGEVAVSATVDDAHVHISVEDTGIGIPTELSDRIFESFEQVHSPETDSYGGAGLGLAITKKLVTRHGGDIRVHSIVGKGSTFTFSLRVSGKEPERLLTRPHEITPLKEHHPITEEVNQEEQRDDMSRFKILIVDDDTVNRQVLVNHLSLYSYQVTEAGRGRQALEILEKDPHFHMVLLDVMMPEITGYEVCRIIRKTHSLQELPVIILTAKDQVTDLLSSFSAGANDFLTKPISKHELLARVRTHLQLSDIYRNLEIKVQERTKELEAKNETVLRSQHQLMTQAKMASMGIITAGVAHEIKNPLNFVNNFAGISSELAQEAQEILAELKSTIPEQAHSNLETLFIDLAQNAERILGHGKRADRIVRNMMEMAGGDKSSEWQLTNLIPMVDEFVDLAWYGFQRRYPEQIEIIKDFDQAIEPAEVLSQKLSQAITQIVNNALESVRLRIHHNPPLPFEPKIWVQLIGRGDFFEILVKDNGMGIDKENIDKIFTPFFTTKTDDEHVGLGLSNCYETVVENHGGQLTVESEVNKFAVFRIRIPIRHIPKSE